MGKQGETETRTLGKVLLAEDEAMIRELIANFLTSLGFEVVEAQNGRDALRVADEVGPENISLLITDLVMPVMGGLELAGELHKRHPQLRVLFISGYTDDIVLTRPEEAERSRFLKKPFNLRSLQAEVEALLQAA